MVHQEAAAAATGTEQFESQRGEGSWRHEQAVPRPARGCQGREAPLPNTPVGAPKRCRGGYSSYVPVGEDGHRLENICNDNLHCVTIPLYYHNKEQQKASVISHSSKRKR